MISTPSATIECDHMDCGLLRLYELTDVGTRSLWSASAIKAYAVLDGWRFLEHVGEELAFCSKSCEDAYFEAMAKGGY